MDSPIAVTDIFKLAVLDLKGVPVRQIKWNGRLWAYFEKKEAEEVLANYEAGHLLVQARDFASSIQRVKDRIFEAERIARTEKGAKNNEINMQSQQQTQKSQ